LNPRKGDELELARHMRIEERIQGERAGYEGGNVREEHARLRARFSHAFLCPNAKRLEIEWEDLAARLAPGADVLEIGAGTGASVGRLLALKPRRIVGVELIEGAVETARQRVPGAEFMVMDAHRTTFDNASFDVIAGRAILHHLEFETAVREVHRLLRPGGTAMFIEPLRDNPAGKLIRALTPRARTRDERPLSRGQIEWANTVFGDQGHRFFGLISTGLGLATSLTALPADNSLLRWADRMDERLSKTPVKYWMRMAMLVWRKTKTIV